MIKPISVFVSILFIVVAMISCQSPKQAKKDVAPTVPSVITDSSEATQCTDPRSQICTKEYRPVCANIDTGIRCVTTPCPSTEKVTKSNACTACSDEKVFSYTPGTCS